MTDAVRRAIRSFAQAFLGTLVGSGILSTFVDSGAVNGDALKKIVVSSVTAGLVATVSLAQNLLEDNVPSFPAVLKAEPSAGLNPVTVDPVPAELKPAAKKPAKKRPAKKAVAKRPAKKAR